MRDGSLMTQLFDERKLEAVGEPVLVAEHVGSFMLSATFSVSASNVLTYRAGKTATPASGLGWYDRKGKDLGYAGEPGTFAYTDLALSPEGTRVATTRVDPSAGTSEEIWLLDLARGVSVRFTFDVAPDFAPVWSPDGRELPLPHGALAQLEFIKNLRTSPGKSKCWWLQQATQSSQTTGRATGVSCCTPSKMPGRMPIYGSCH